MVPWTWSKNEFEFGTSESDLANAECVVDRIPHLYILVWNVWFLATSSYHRRETETSFIFRVPTYDREDTEWSVDQTCPSCMLTVHIDLCSVEHNYRIGWSLVQVSCGTKRIFIFLTIFLKSLFFGSRKRGTSGLTLDISIENCSAFKWLFYVENAR